MFSLVMTNKASYFSVNDCVSNYFFSSGSLCGRSGRRGQRKFSATFDTGNS